MQTIPNVKNWHDPDEVYAALVGRFVCKPEEQLQGEPLGVDRDGERQQQKIQALPTMRDLVKRLESIDAAAAASAQSVVEDHQRKVAEQWNEARSKNGWHRLARLGDPLPP